VISEAVIRLGVPRKCGIVELPESLRPGDMVVLSEGNGRCGLKKIARLNGAHRLIMGKGLNINQDSIEDLSLLPGIGPGKAKWIIDNRKKNGPFKTLDELERVRGIGPTTVMRLKSWLEWPDGR
jgi:competence ComEA-like helix-hairpin-helix protein